LAKDGVVDARTQSKEEHEVEVGSASALRGLLLAAGLRVDIEFVKDCTNWKFDYEGRDVLATVVHVSELTETFIEIESLVESPDGVLAALDAIRRLAGEIGLHQMDESSDAYTDAVRRARAASPGEIEAETAR
jgi:adenylate cyclase class 2